MVNREKIADRVANAQGSCDNLKDVNEIVYGKHDAGQQLHHGVILEELILF